jgi:hypothetical protein
MGPNTKDLVDHLLAQRAGRLRRGDHQVARHLDLVERILVA